MSEVKLLPLPEHMKAWANSLADDAQAYARANIEPLLAENERLRGEVEKWRRPCQEFLDKTEWVQHTGTVRELGHHRADILRERIQRAEARAERLAEALRLALKWAEVLPTGEPLRAESVRDLDNARAALDQEGGNG